MDDGITDEEVVHPSEGRRSLFVVGSGRSGTSTLARALEILGMHVPAPVVPADHTNPKGFGESQWLVDFHDKLLRKANVTMGDARPQAWFDTGRYSTNNKLRERARLWLAEQYSDEVNELVLKDPRLVWFLGLWRQAAERSGIQASYAVMLRPPAEVLASKERYYGAQVSETSRAATWLNLMLHTERATRGFPRAFVRYHDLLEDWTVPVHRLGEDFGLQAVVAATGRELRHVHDLIDPEMRRVRADWADLDVPKPVRHLLEECWHQLDRLAEPEADTAERHSLFDELRDSYARMYADAEAMTETTALAARRHGRREKRQGRRKRRTARTAAARSAGAPVPADPVADRPFAAARRWLRRWSSEGRP